MFAAGLTPVPHTIERVDSYGHREVSQLYCVVCEPEVRGAEVQNFSSEMMHWDDYRQRMGVQDDVPPMSQIFQNSSSPSEKPMKGNQAADVRNGERHMYLLRSLVCVEQYLGSPNQNLSCEMLRWDDYRTANNANDGTGVMGSLFGFRPTFNGHLVDFQGAENADPQIWLIKNFVCKEEVMGAPCQDICTEMLRFDAEMAQMPPDSLIGFVPLELLFRRTTSFAGHLVPYVKPANRERQLLCVKSIACRKEFSFRTEQHLNTEMLRWDDLRETNQVRDGAPLMREVLNLVL